jgi:transcriptional regulator with XRE-family HTH domain
MPVTDTAGRHRLREALAERGEKRRLAELCGVSRAAVSRWIGGAARPDASHRTVIRTYLASRTGDPVELPESLWLTAEESAAIERAGAP